MFLLWIGLFGAGLLCVLRGYLNRQIAGRRARRWCSRITAALVTLISAVAYYFGSDAGWFADSAMILDDHWPFLVRNVGHHLRRDGAGAALFLRHARMAPQRRAAGQGARARAAGAHPAALPLQQHEHHRRAHAQQPGARRRGRAGSRRPVPRQSQREAQPDLARRGDRRGAHLPAHGAAAPRRPAARRMEDRLAADATRWCPASRCSRCSRTPSTTASSRAPTAAWSRSPANSTRA